MSDGDIKVLLLSIVDIAPPGERTEQFGRYRVTINAGGIEQRTKSLRDSPLTRGPYPRAREPE